MLASTAHARPAACLWDFDGTVADTEPIWIGCEYELVAMLGGTWNDGHAEHLIGSDLLNAARYLLAVTGRDDLTPTWVAQWMVARVAHKLATTEIAWRPGARELLAALGAAGVPCALVSASYRSLLDAVLEQLPAGTFATVVGGDEVAVGKPAPDPYLQAAAALGVAAADCVVLEDSLPGTRSGQAAGAWVIGIPNAIPLPLHPRRTVIRTMAGITPGALFALVGAPFAEEPLMGTPR